MYIFVTYPKERDKRPKIYRKYKWPHLSLEGTGFLSSAQTHHEFQQSMRLQTWRAQWSLADNLRDSCPIFITQPVMSHHHKRYNPIERNDIGGKGFRRSRCVRTMEDSNTKFNKAPWRAAEWVFMIGWIKFIISWSCGCSPVALISGKCEHLSGSFLQSFSPSQRYFLAPL